MIPTKPLGRDGAEIPALGLGVFRMPAEDTARMTRTALELGYRHIDTAQIYGNEADVGRGMAEAGVPREQIFLTTKVWVDHYGRPTCCARSRKAWRGCAPITWTCCCCTGPATRRRWPSRSMR